MASVSEMRFLALCLPRMSGDTGDLRAGLPSLEWSTLLATSNWQGMMPLAASRLLASAIEAESGLPAAVVSELSAYQSRHVLRTLTQTAALLELQREFDRDGLRVVPWKGSSMAMLLYGAATLREAVDLDFLFLQKDIQAILQIARRLGYSLLGATGNESKDIYILSQQREFTFVRQRDRLILEFHLQVLPSRFSLWQDSHVDVHRATNLLPIADVTLHLQSPEDLLVSLCAHATKHNWDRLKWSCDIAQFVRVYKSEIAWKPFLERLRSEKKDGVVLLGLALAGKIFPIGLPVEVASVLETKPSLLSLVQELADHIMSGSTEMAGLQLRRAMLALLCPRLFDRIAYILRPIVELNYQDLQIPVQNRAFFFLNYGFRIFRLLRKYGPGSLVSKTAASLRAVR